MPRVGFKHSEESKSKMRESLKGRLGRPMPEYTKMKLLESRLGKKHNPEAIEKMKIAQLGKRHSEATLEKMRGPRAKRPGSIGHAHTEESKNKIRMAHLGKVHGYRHPMGDKAHGWRGGKTDLFKIIRALFEYRLWRSDVFKRDAFVCQECRDESKNRLHAHHLVSFSSIVRKHEIVTTEQAINCSELWDINNGITLCKDCHKRLHRWMK